MNQKLVAQIKSKKAEVIAQMIFPNLTEDTDSVEVMEMAAAITTDMDIVDEVLVLVEKMLYPEGDEMDEDPGIEAAEEQFAAEEDTYYEELGDAESEN